MCRTTSRRGATARASPAFAWSWLGAALQATTLPFGVVNAPGQRYHPAIIAQAIGTLAAMYPGRFWAALGTGEASNEHITGDAVAAQGRAQRPAARVRRRHPRAAAPARRSATTAWSPSTGPGCGPGPSSPPALVGAAVSEATAAWCAEWADGLITVNAPVETPARMIGAYRDAGGRGDVDLQVHLSWAPDQAEAEAIAYEQWRSNVFAPPVCWDMETAEHFDAVSENVPDGAGRSRS